MADRVRDLTARFDSLYRRASERDARARDIRAIRTNNPEVVFSGLFPPEWPKPLVANFIDVVAKDTAEMVGVMPTITASGDTALDEGRRTKVDKRTKIANYYPHASRANVTLPVAADRLNTYGFLPIRIEPNYGEKRPHIHFDDPWLSYPDVDRWGRVTAYAKLFWKKAAELATLFPEHANELIPNSLMGRANTNETLIRVVKWYDKDRVVMFIPDRDGLVLEQYANPIDRVPVALAVMPSLDDQMRGAYDDVLWVYAAKVKLAFMSMDAVEKAVGAPIVLPSDVEHLAIGPDALMRTQNPQGVRRLSLELPNSAIIQDKNLDDELRLGARFPQARTGDMPGSVVTGRGIQELMGGFDARIQAAQNIMGFALADAISMCMEMDVALWPNEQKSVQAQHNGTPYDLKYTPSKDIGDETNVTYQYGIMAGMDPNRALVWSLQALGAGLVSERFVRQNLPVALNVQEEERVIDIEQMRKAALAAVQQLPNAIPMMAQQGQDPTSLIQQYADLIAARKKGTPIEEAIKMAFTPKEPPASQGSGAETPNESSGAPDLTGGGSPGDMGMGGDQSMGGMSAPPGGAPQAPPAMQELLAGLTGGGRPSLGARITRRTPAA